MRTFLLSLILTATPFFIGSAQQHKVVLTPRLDSYIHNVNGDRSSQKEVNGSKTYLLVSSLKTRSFSNETENRAILSFEKYEFDIDDLISAELKLYYRPGYGPHTGDNNIDIHWYRESKKNNHERDINWDNAPGIDYSLCFLRHPGPGESEKDISINVTELFKLYYNSRKHIGLCLKISIPSYFKEQRIIIASKEYIDQSKHPQLILTLEGDNKAVKYSQIFQPEMKSKEKS